MHLLKNTILLVTLVVSSIAVVGPVAARAPGFDKFFGSFNPPDYIPIDVSADNSGNIFVLDIYHERIRKLDQNGNVLQEITLDAKWLRGIEVDSNGNIYVVDAAGATSGINSDAVISKLDPQGNLIELWPSSARGIGIDASDRIYTVSEVTGTVTVLDTSGNILLEFGAGILSQPEDVDATLDGTFIYVADSGNGRIVKFDAAGNLLTSWGNYGTGDMEFKNPVSLSVDQSGNVFVTDRRNFKIKKFDPNGILLALTGDQGTGPGLFQEPHGNTVDPFGNLWLATYHGHDVQKFDNDLNYLLTVAGTRSAPGEFADVRGVGVDSERNVYVADKWLQRVTKFDRDGNYLMHFGIRGQGEAAEFNFPRTVHVDVHDSVYVSDDGHVRKFDTDGNYITRYGKYLYIQGLTTDATGNLLFAARTSHHKITRVDQTTLAELTFGVKGTGPGEFDQPWGIAVGPNGMLYVADSNNARVQRLSLDGVYDMEWGSFGSQPGQFKKPTGLVIDAAGNVYVGDAQNDNIQVFDPEGNYLYGWGTRGTGPGQFNKIWSLALEEGNAIYAGDVFNSSLQRFTFDKLLDPSGFPAYTVGTDRGFFIGSDGFNNWKIHWGGNGPREVFSGTISCDQPVQEASPWRYESNDTLTVNGGIITFSGIARSGDDGFTFTTPANTTCNFDLFVNGIHQSANVYIGASAEVPLKLPFSLVSGMTNVESINPAGKPSYTPGVDLGSFLWFDRNKGLWKLRMSTINGENHNFAGTITTDGTFTNVAPIGMESQDTLDASSNSLNFDMKIASHQDGINFSTQNAATISVDILLDGIHLVGAVYVGAASENPQTLPFDLGIPAQ